MWIPNHHLKNVLRKILPTPNIHLGEGWESVSFTNIACPLLFRKGEDFQIGNFSWGGIETKRQSNIW